MAKKEKRGKKRDCLGGIVDSASAEYCSTFQYLFVSPFVQGCTGVTSPLYDVLYHTNHIFSESSWSKDIKIDITKCLIHKYTNTNTQIHKYSILTVP